jgi:DNA-binding response OmpR family regulator
VTNRHTDAPMVLIIDDDDSIRQVLSLGLEMEGFRTATAQDGFNGLRSAVHEPPDVVVLDMMMPGRDGFTVLDGLRSREELAEIPVVMLTARAGAQDFERVLAAGADRYMTKPFVLDHLVWQLHEVLADAARHRAQHAPTTSTALAPSSVLALR